MRPAGGEYGAEGKSNGSGRPGLSGRPSFEPSDAQREQASRLESIGQLAGGVAHDFNNLLGVILNYADFVAQELEDGSRVHSDVLEIRRAAERATELTRQLLIFSRREVVQPTPVDLNDSVYEAERFLRRTLGEHIELVVDLAPDLPTVLGDTGQLEQVLLNLAVNARDAMPEGGSLRIETAEVDLDAAFLREHPEASPGRHVRLSVSDTGSGMTTEVAAHAFEPFFSTKRKGEGTGLGLATVYGIVKGVGGEIDVYSQRGKGTTFVILLPAVDAPVPADSGEEPLEGVPLGTGEHVLVVEDEDSVRTLAIRILTRGGYRVSAVSRGSEAVDLLADPEETFDLLLSDVVMPEMRGVELVGRARELRPELPVLMMSGYTTPLSDTERAAIAEAPLIEKPFSSNQLLRRTSELLGVRAGR